MRAGSADRNELAASESEARERSHYARPGQASSDERSYKFFSTLAVETFRCLEKEGIDLIDQVATSIVGGVHGSSLERKGVCNERLFQVISVTTRGSRSHAECTDTNWH